MSVPNEARMFRRYGINFCDAVYILSRYVLRFLSGGRKKPIIHYGKGWLQPVTCLILSSLQVKSHTYAHLHGYLICATSYLS